MEDDIFVEVVLNDGAALQDVERLLRGIAEELKLQGVKLDVIVRARWKVLGVNYVGPSRTADGGLRAALEFRAQLKSGSQEWQVTVDVTWAAVELLEGRFGLKKSSVEESDEVERRRLAGEMVNRVVRSFLEFQLAAGGTSYWDPVLHSQLELNEPAMSFILGQSTAFEELRQAVADALEPPVLESFVKGLSVSRIRIREFDAILPELSSMLGGAYRRGGTFSTSADELYKRLDRTEQELLKKYFNTKVAQLKKDPKCSELRKQFPRVFS
jgi:hypothetical protein